MIDPVVIPVLGVTIPIVVVPSAMLAKYAISKRNLEHTERMKALELGLTLPRDEPWWSPPRIAVALGVVVPLGVFLFAWLASQSLGYQPGVWISAMVVGTSGVGCGMALAVRYLGHKERLVNSGDWYAKPVIEEDAFDVVGSRG